MLLSPKLYLADWWIRLSLAFSLVLQAVIWWYIATHIHYSNQPIFLHYNVIFGVDLVGDWWEIWLFPAAGLGAALINFLAAYFCYTVDAFLARFFAVGAALLQLLTLIAVIFIAGLNL